LVLVLRRLPIHFSRRPLRIGAWGRWGIAISTAVVLCGTALYAADARYREALGRGLIEPAYEVGGGHNVVNVTLVDARVWDTLGEISVLLVVATGVASLIFVTRREQSISRVRDLDEGVSIWHRRPDTDLPKNVLDFDARPDDVAGGNRWRTWLSAGLTLAPERRMVILEVVTRIAFPLMMTFSLFLLMAGHNEPGGGFVGGLVAGLALVLRYLAGGRYELSEAAPVQAGFVLGSGMVIAVTAGVLPLLFGGTVFASATPVLHVPLLGELHFPSALLFDFGVYLVVVGVMLDFLRSLGAQIDQQQEAASDARSSRRAAARRRPDRLRRVPVPRADPAPHRAGLRDARNRGQPAVHHRGGPDRHTPLRGQRRSRLDDRPLAVRDGADRHRDLPGRDRPGHRLGLPGLAAVRPRRGPR